MRRGDGRLVVGECEAFLSGRYAEQQEAAGWRLAPWVFLNRIAHVDVEELQDLAEYGSDAERGNPYRRWIQAASFLAVEVLLRVGSDPAAVRKIQLEVLVPIELEWIAGTDLVHRTPSELVPAVLGAFASIDCHSSEFRRAPSPGQRESDAFRIGARVNSRLLGSTKWICGAHRATRREFRPADETGNHQPTGIA
jgi:hypothetical protein